MPGPVNPTKAYLVRLGALRRLEEFVKEAGIPACMILDFPQMASSFDEDYYQPLLLAGDLARIQDVRYLYDDERDRWFYTVGSWFNDRGSDTGQVAGELAMWWAEVLADDITKRPTRF